MGSSERQMVEQLQRLVAVSVTQRMGAASANGCHLERQMVEQLLRLVAVSVRQRIGPSLRQCPSRLALRPLSLGRSRCNRGFCTYLVNLYAA